MWGEWGTYGEALKHKCTERVFLGRPPHSASHSCSNTCRLNMQTKRQQNYYSTVKIWPWSPYTTLDATLMPILNLYASQHEPVLDSGANFGTSIHPHTMYSQDDLHVFSHSKHWKALSTFQQSTMNGRECSTMNGRSWLNCCAKELLCSPPVITALLTTSLATGKIKPIVRKWKVWKKCESHMCNHSTA